MERNEFIKVRVTPEEREAITRRARDLGLSVSDLIRQAMMGLVTVRAIDSGAAFSQSVFV
jgi:antitoxin component of RelBE/YafQ-DinJ toxin-antitoxin module